MSTQGTDGGSVTVGLPDPLHALSKSLYRRIPTMPRASRRFAYNLIELIEGGAMSITPHGDHPTQRPARLIEYQMARLSGQQ